MNLDNYNCTHDTRYLVSSSVHIYQNIAFNFIAAPDVQKQQISKSKSGHATARWFGNISIFS